MADDLEDDEITPLPYRPGDIARIGRPAQPSPIPAVTLRGLGAPAAGSTADLESQGMASHLAPRPMAAPSPIGTRTGADQSELSRLDSTGSGISQVAKAHPIAGGILRGLNTVGEIAGAFSPQVKPILRAIPGTEEHHQQLIGQQTGRIGEDLGEQKEQGAIGETAANTEKAEAAAAKDTADAAKAAHEAQKPFTPEKPENVQQIYADAVQDAINRGVDPNADPKVKQLADTITSLQKQPAQQKPDTPEQQFIDEFTRTHPKATISEAITAYANATQKPDKPQRQLAVINGKVVELVPGMDASGAQSIGGSEKAGAAGQAGADALSYANDYMAQGKFTGPGDEALMEKYFELAKPSSGFRMSQQQIEMLTRARDLMGGLEAKAKHLFTPDAPYFSDEQRKQIVATMSEIENTKGKQGGANKSISEPMRPANVPANYVYQKNGVKGEGWYKP